MNLPELDEHDYSGRYTEAGFDVRKRREFIPVSEEDSYLDVDVIKYYGILWNIPLKIGLIKNSIVTATHRATGKQIKMLTEYLEVPRSPNAFS